MVNKGKKYSFVIILFCSIIFSYTAKSETTLSINDTTIDRYGTYIIPILFTTTQTSITDVKLILAFDPRIIRIKSVKGGTGFLIKQSSPDTSFTYGKSDTAFCQISSKDVQNLAGGVVCLVEIQGLVFSDSVSYISPVKLFINGNEETSFYKRNGKIVVTGVSFILNIPDAIGQNYPNPFSYLTKFDFSIEGETGISFAIYDSDGRLELSSDENNGAFVVQSFDGQKIFKDLNYSFPEASNYTLIFTPPVWEIQSGAHYLLMKTSRGEYITKFLYLK